MKCETCEDTGFYGENGPGIIGNLAWHQCPCGTEDEIQTALAEATDKASRGWGHLETIWKACMFSFEWEYGSLLEEQVIDKIKELEARNKQLEGALSQEEGK